MLLIVTFVHVAGSVGKGISEEEGRCSLKPSSTGCYRVCGCVRVSVDVV
jgi:hypothetical protein